VKRWFDRWNRYWFPTTTTRPLALCRIIAVTAQLVWHIPDLEPQIKLALKNQAFVDPQALIRAISFIIPRSVFFTPQVITALYWITLVAGLTALVGLFTRTSLFVFALGNWIFISHKYSYAELHHTEALFCIFLMALAFAPSGQSLSIDALIRRHRARRAGTATALLERSDTAMWPLKLAHVLLALTYFSTGASKLLASGLGWMNGYTIQIYTFADAMGHNRPLGIWLAQYHTLGVLLGAFTVFFELFFFVSLILPRTAPFFFLTAIFFHVGLYVLMGHPFFPHILMNAMLLAFLDPNWFRNLVNEYKVQVSRWQTRASS
jgi:vitamin K-dependent gamma-carboxylase-like protein